MSDKQALAQTKSEADTIADILCRQHANIPECIDVEDQNDIRPDNKFEVAYVIYGTDKEVLKQGLADTYSPLFSKTAAKKEAEHVARRAMQNLSTKDE